MKPECGTMWALSKIISRLDKAIEAASKPTPVLITPREFENEEEFIEWDEKRNLFEQTNNERKQDERE